MECTKTVEQNHAVSKSIGSFAGLTLPLLGLKTPKKAYKARNTATKRQPFSSFAVCGFFLLITFFASPVGIHAQIYAPGNFSYSGPAIFTVGNTITPLTPVATQAGTISTIGSGFGYPYGIAVDTIGNVYVADASDSAILKISANGTVISLGSGLSGALGVVVDSKGNIFVADAGNNAVKEITAASGYKTINTLGSGFNSPSGLALDGIGNLYVADAGNGAIKELVAPGYTTIITFTQTFGYPTGVALDAAGNIFVADAGNNAVSEISAASNYTTVTNLGAGFNNPRSLALDVFGNLFVADNNNTAVKELTAASGYTTIQTVGAGWYVPTGVAVDATGNIFVAEADSGYVKELIGAGGVVANYSVSPALPAGLTLNAKTGSISGTPTLASPSTPYTITAANTGGSSTAVLSIAVNLPFAPANFNYTSPQVYAVNSAITPLAPVTVPVGTVTQVGLNYGYPYGVAIDKFGNVYVADAGKNEVDRINPDGSITALGHGFNSPLGVVVDSAGNVFVADAGNNAVKEITASSQFKSIVTVGSGFNSPTGITLDAAGNVYVADAGNGAVKKIAAPGYTTVTTLGPGFAYPKGVALDAAGNLFVADAGFNEVIRSTAALGYNDTTTISTGLNQPSGIALDKMGNVYVADKNNNAIKEISAANGYKTTKKLGFVLSGPTGVAVDAAGNLFVAEADTADIKEITGAGGPVAIYTIHPTLPAGLVLNAANGLISGTPTAISPAILYTITASNAGGITTDTVTIAVVKNTLATTFGGINANQLNGGISVHWQTLTELGTKKYILQKSANGQNFATVYQINARNSGRPEQYMWYDAQPNNGANYYRVQVVNNDGSFTYSSIVVVKIYGPQPAFAVYPNPAQPSTQVQAMFYNINAGKYQLTIYSLNGRAVLKQLVQHTGGTVSKTITLPAGLAAGNYRIVLADENGNSWKQPLQVQ